MSKLSKLLEDEDFLGECAEGVVDALFEADARIAELEAALKPFADAGSFTKTYEYSEDTEMAIPFTWGQLRAAHAAMGKKND